MLNGLSGVIGPRIPCRPHSVPARPPAYPHTPTPTRPPACCHTMLERPSPPSRSSSPPPSCLFKQPRCILAQSVISLLYATLLKKLRYYFGSGSSSYAMPTYSTPTNTNINTRPLASCHVGTTTSRRFLALLRPLLPVEATHQKYSNTLQL